MRTKDAIIENLTGKPIAPTCTATVRAIRQSYLRTALLIEAEVPASTLRARTLELLLESHLMAIHAVRHTGRRNVKEEQERSLRNYERKVRGGERSEDASGSGEGEEKPTAVSEGQSGDAQASGHADKPGEGG